MATIHVLDSETIDRIAAGEVVERPLNVVKELVENSIDAGADAVTVEAKDGGIEFLRVTDNGSGIDAKQLPTAFLRHATSKITNSEDLDHIESLGFRGEALSSIAAVSKVEIVTKTVNELTGTRMVLEGASVKAVEEVGAPNGTTFIMRNLFFNTPVRRKFLRQPSTEGSYIADLMEHLALSRPDVSFKFVLGNQTKFNTSGNGDLKEVIYRIYGRDIAKAIIPIQYEENGIRIEGYLGKPNIVRSNRNHEIYFINNRYIRSMTIAKAIEEGYKQYLMQHKFPFCVLHISVLPENVDVNVHPSKMEVRFSDAPSFNNLLVKAIQNTLQKREMIPEGYLDDASKEVKAVSNEKTKRTPELFEVKREAVYIKDRINEYNLVMEPGNDFKSSPVWNRVKSSVEHNEEVESTEVQNADEEEIFFVEDNFDANIPANIEANSKQATEINDVIDATDSTEATEQVTKNNSVIEATKATEQATKNNSVIETIDATAQFTINNSVIEATDDAEQATKNYNVIKATENRDSVDGLDNVSAQQINLFEDKLLSISNRQKYRIIGQVFDTYWLVQFEKKLFIIDQHAAHEKVMFEKLMKQFEEKNVLSQVLMPPIIVTLGSTEIQVLQDNIEVFNELGFEIEPFGGNEYALRSVPVDLYGCNEKEMFLEVLDELTDGGIRGNVKVIHEKLASMSCKAAVKGNNSLSLDEADSLIDQLLALENPYNCPHGRPTIITISQYEMEKKFKRII